MFKALHFPRFFKILYILFKFLIQVSEKCKVEMIIKSYDSEIVVDAFQKPTYAQTYSRYL